MSASAEWELPADTLRFTKEQIHHILPQLQLDRVQLRNRYTATSEEMFCLLLRRLAFPTRLASLCSEFGHSRGWCSSVFTDVTLHLYNRWHQALRWNTGFLTLQRLQSYATAIEILGGGDCYWGYIDGTIVQIGRPEVHQRLWYSGYKHLHCFKYQCIVTPDGLIASAAGPYVGKRADAWMLRESELSVRLREVFFVLGRGFS